VTLNLKHYPTEEEHENIKRVKKYFLKFQIIKTFTSYHLKKNNTYPSADLRIKFETTNQKKRQNIISNLPEEFRQQSDKTNMFQCTFLVKKKCNKKVP